MSKSQDFFSEMILSSIELLKAEERTAFLTLYTQFVAADWQSLIRGVIPLATRREALTSACQDLKSKFPGTERWSDMLMLSISVNSCTTQASQEQAQKKNATQATQPKTASVAQNAQPSSQEKRKPLHPRDFTGLYDDLLAKTSSGKGRIFPAEGNALRCDRNLCNTCPYIMRHVTPTACRNHTPCHPSGFYPHVGAGLWSKLVQVHEENRADGLKVVQNKQHSLPCLVSYLGDTSPEQLATFDRSPKRQRITSNPLSDTALWSEIMDDSQSEDYDVANAFAKASKAAETTNTEDQESQMYSA